MGNYYSYERIGDKPLKVPKVCFEDRESVECLIAHGWVDSKRWDMVADMCRLSEEIEDELVTIDFTHEDSSDKWRVMFFNGKYCCVKAEFPPMDLNNLKLPNYDSGRNTFDLTQVTYYEVGNSCHIDNEQK